MKIKEVKKYIKTASVIGFADWFLYLYANEGCYETVALVTTLTFFYVFQDMKKQSNERLYHHFKLNSQNLMQLDEAQRAITQIPPNIVAGASDAFDRLFSLLPRS